MDIPGIVGRAVDTVFNITASIAVTGVYHRITPGAYTPSSGTAAVTDTTYNVSVRTALFEQREIDGDRIRSGDKKILVKTSEMTGVPTADDYFVDSNSKRWDLMYLATEPTYKLLILRGRAHAL